MLFIVPVIPNSVFFPVATSATLLISSMHFSFLQASAGISLFSIQSSSKCSHQLQKTQFLRVSKSKRKLSSTFIFTKSWLRTILRNSLNGNSSSRKQIKYVNIAKIVASFFRLVCCFLILNKALLKAWRKFLYLSYPQKTCFKKTLSLSYNLSCDRKSCACESGVMMFQLQDSMSSWHFFIRSEYFIIRNYKLQVTNQTIPKQPPSFILNGMENYGVCSFIIFLNPGLNYHLLSQQSIQLCANNSYKMNKEKLEADEEKQDRLAHFEQHLKGFNSKLEEMEKEIMRMPNNIDQFKNHCLPLARIKKIMKSDEDVRMISSETPVLFAKACEIFIVELTYRAWAFTLDSKRRTLQKSDVSACIYNTQIFDFLIDIIPKEDLKSLKKLPAEGMFNPIPK